MEVIKQVQVNIKMNKHKCRMYNVHLVIVTSSHDQFLTHLGEKIPAPCRLHTFHTVGTWKPSVETPVDSDLIMLLQRIGARLIIRCPFAGFTADICWDSEVKGRGRQRGGKEKKPSCRHAAKECHTWTGLICWCACAARPSSLAPPPLMGLASATC